jgi:RNA polymerase sigma factor (sigma-70 family)
VSPAVEELLRELAPQVLAAVVRRHQAFDEGEDAVQEALLAAALQWPTEGVPDNPRGWLVTVASRRLADLWRSDEARRRREANAAATVALEPSTVEVSSYDDTLTLLFLCCHPGLSPASQVALTLRAVGGLTTSEIARAFFVPEATMAQRISRAKQRIKADEAPFRRPEPAEVAQRLGAVLHVLYLIFNEGYTSSSGPDLQRADLTTEAIRLTRIVHRARPGDAEVTGLLALMLLTEARRPARVDADGRLIPLAEQDRGRWDGAAIAEGVGLISATLPRATIGPYQLQAAIAAVHDEAARAEETDWRQIDSLYEVLTRIAPNPMVTLNHAVARAMVFGPRAGLELLAELDSDDRVAGHHRLYAVRAHLLELNGDPAGARAAYLAAARATTSGPERRYLEGRAARINDRGTVPGAGPSGARARSPKERHGAGSQPDPR